ncbi:polyhydroxyalkanoic acid system family protein [Massilia sp. TS11]|uniref:polyhydroxyalkanoic acid system family protein n=1 Tax=Massilia sp. TS11 TaxID=2908003 RepID=UPI001EDA132F|nr:polyhydroxyalkanoic acid system family protein [Massilia sp. TS11]MCG2586013.1 polyhydroxyalkanoic acid system family protein [Massilia sp. TS11]
MSEITIVQPHKLSPKQAREAAERVAKEIAAEYDMEYAWEGEVLYFERSGVHGSLTLQEGQVEMFIKLGFLMSAFAGAIEAKVAQNLKKIFK